MTKVDFAFIPIGALFIHIQTDIYIIHNCIVIDISRHTGMLTAIMMINVQSENARC